MQPKQRLFSYVCHISPFYFEVINKCGYTICFLVFVFCLLKICIKRSYFGDVICYDGNVKSCCHSNAIGVQRCHRYRFRLKVAPTFFHFSMQQILGCVIAICFLLLAVYVTTVFLSYQPMPLTLELCCN